MGRPPARSPIPKPSNAQSQRHLGGVRRFPFYELVAVHLSALAAHALLLCIYLRVAAARRLGQVKAQKHGVRRERDQVALTTHFLGIHLRVAAARRLGKLKATKQGVRGERDQVALDTHY